MKILDFKTYCEKLNANSISFDDLKDIDVDIDDMPEFTVHKSDVKLFDIVETKKHDFYMAFVGSTAADIFDTFSPSEYFIKNKIGAFIRFGIYDYSQNLHCVFTRRFDEYSDDLKCVNDSDLDILTVYLCPNFNDVHESITKEIRNTVYKLQKETLKSFIDDYKYQKIDLS